MNKRTGRRISFPSPCLPLNYSFYPKCPSPLSTVFFLQPYQSFKVQTKTHLLTKDLTPFGVWPGGSSLSFCIFFCLDPEQRETAPGPFTFTQRLNISEDLVQGRTEDTHFGGPQSEGRILGNDHGHLALTFLLALSCPSFGIWDNVYWRTLRTPNPEGVALWNSGKTGRGRRRAEFESWFCH